VSELDRKRAKVTGGSKKKGGSRQSPSPATLIFFGVLILTAAFLFLRPGRQPGGGGATNGNSNLQMTDITASIKDGKIAIPLSTVKEKQLVRFVYKGEKEVPLLAYLAPSGKVVTAVSMCEPCASTRFFIQGKKIICITCGTQWDLETLKGISGGCTTYPPDRLTNSTGGEEILIEESSAANWKSRI
jgi:hypothetical protein